MVKIHGRSHLLHVVPYFRSNFTDVSASHPRAGFLREKAASVSLKEAPPDAWSWNHLQTHVRGLWQLCIAGISQRSLQRNEELEVSWLWQNNVRDILPVTATMPEKRRKRSANWDKELHADAGFGSNREQVEDGRGKGQNISTQLKYLTIAEENESNEPRVHQAH